MAKQAEKAGGVMIQSLERAADIMSLAGSTRGGLRLSEISRELGLHTSTVFHLVRSLCALGFLRLDEKTKRYQIGRRIFSLASNCLDEVELIELVRPRIAALAEATGQSAHFAVWSRHDVLVLCRDHGPAAFQLSERIGSIRPAYCTAIGRALLSGLNPGQLDEYFRHVELRPLTPDTVVDETRLRAIIDQVRRERIAYDDSEYQGEARCVAAPVLDYNGAVAGSVGISAPVWRVSFEELVQFAEQVRGAAEDLSRELGHTPSETAEPTTPGMAGGSG